MLIRFCR